MDNFDSGDAILEFLSGNTRNPAEVAHRRGYCEGYEAALRHIRAGFAISSMDDHADALQEWRERCIRESLGYVEPPTLRYKS